MTSREYIENKAAVMARTLDELRPGFDCQNGKNPIAGCGRMPTRVEVIQVLTLLDDVLYPGYRTSLASDEPVESRAIQRLDEAYDLLYGLVKRALPLRRRPETQRSPLAPAGFGAPADDVVEETERVLSIFFARLPAVRELLKRDVVAAYDGDPAAHSYSEVILSYPCIRAITTHRLAHELYLLDVPIIPRLMNEHIHSRTGVDIHPGASIGESFFIDHGTGVVIGETTTIGNRVKIYQGVTLGAKSFPLDELGRPVKGIKRHPTIEDDVVIYAGATILGGDTVIGRGSVINGNVFITHSVAPNTTYTQRMAAQALHR